MGKFEIKGFQVLPVSFPERKSKQYVFYKKHDAKNQASEGPGDRSLFMANLPVMSDLSVVRRYFQTVALGATIESFTPSYLTNCPEDVWINLTKLTSDLPVNNIDEAASKLPKNSAVVTFIDRASFQLAFSALKKLSASAQLTTWPLAGATSPSSSAAYYLAKLKSDVLDSEQLAAEVSQALADFDRAEKQSMEELQDQANLVDEDGFTLVVGSHRKTKAGILGKQKLASTVESEKAKAKLKKKETQDFYRFQLRQRKKDEMNELLNKYKADQEKVRLMKEKKRFRPY
ncbi:uncharacterized protein LODBEIA_P44140 [Lodderomyces beijingensis]|uniref:Ribosomal RNA-processing protein 7 C-terminal domain-containing protein n=1 Tax=Lodderomyces beijingensis TaxID=1775926 RepID=A0ABP0ZSK2_9ASCO